MGVRGRSFVLVAALAQLGCGGGSLREVRGATYELSGTETQIADRYDAQDPKLADLGTRCQYWQNMRNDARRPHAIGVLVWQPDHFPNLQAWTDAHAQDVCSTAPQQARGVAIRSMPGQPVGIVTGPRTGVARGPFSYTMRFDADTATVSVFAQNGGAPYASADLCLRHAHGNLPLHTDSGGVVHIDMTQPAFSADSMIRGPETGSIGINDLMLYFAPCEGLDQAIARTPGVQRIFPLSIESWRGYPALKDAAERKRVESRQDLESRQRQYAVVRADLANCMGGSVSACRSCVDDAACVAIDLHHDALRKACVLKYEPACEKLQAASVSTPSGCISACVLESRQCADQVVRAGFPAGGDTFFILCGSERGIEASRCEHACSEGRSSIVPKTSAH
jgi:hypothetical protein